MIFLRRIFLRTVISYLGISLLSTAVLFLPVKAEDKPKETEQKELLDKTHRILQLVNKLESKDEAEKKAAFKELRDIGSPVMPYLMDKLKEKAVYLELASQIQAFHPPTTEELKSSMHVWQEMMGIKNDKEIALIERYFYSKYLSAAQFYQREDYQSALDIINAIIKLESNISFANKLKLFKLACEEKIVQKNIIRANLRTPRDAYEIGEKIFVTLKLENVALAPVEITLPQDPIIIIYINATEYGPYGDYLSSSRMEEEKLTIKNISINAQKFWEYTFALDTSVEGVKTINYRTYEVVTELRPGRLKTDKEESIRKIISLPITIRTFPPKIDKVLKDPLPSLAKALDEGIPIDIFLCALLVPETDKEKAIDLLMRSIDKSTEDAKKTIMTALKHITRIPVELEEKAWRQWWEERKKNK
jgi:hypothetical protein